MKINLEKIKKFWDVYKIWIIAILAAIAVILIISIIAVYIYDDAQGVPSTGMYGMLVSWTSWFDPILKSLVGIACLKYIFLHWK